MRIKERELLVAEDGMAYLSDVSSKNYPKVEKLNTPTSVYQTMIENFNLDKKAEEHIYMIAVDTKNKPISFFEISHGGVDRSIMDTRGILIKALLSNASGIFITHNHPSGDVTPSRQDVLSTKKLKEICDLVSIVLLDHIIIGPKNYCSLSENNLM